MLELWLSFQGPQGSKSSYYSLHTISGSGRNFSLFFGHWVPFCCTQMWHFPFLIYFPQPLGSHPALIAKEKFPWKQELVHYILYLTGPVPKWLLFIFIPLFLCSLLPKIKIYLKSSEWHWRDYFAMGGMWEVQVILSSTPFWSQERSWTCSELLNKCPSWGFCFSSLLPKADSLDGGCGCGLDGPRTSHNWVHILHLETIQGKIQTEEAWIQL